METTKRNELRVALQPYLKIKDVSPELPFVIMDAHLATFEEVIDVMREMGFSRFRHDV